MKLAKSDDIGKQKAMIRNQQNNYTEFAKSDNIELVDMTI